MFNWKKNFFKIFQNFNNRIILNLQYMIKETIKQDEKLIIAINIHELK